MTDTPPTDNDPVDQETDNNSPEKGMRSMLAEWDREVLRAVICSITVIIVTGFIVLVIAAGLGPGLGVGPRALLLIAAICLGLTASAWLFGESLMSRLAFDLDMFFRFIDRKLNLFGPDCRSVGGLRGHGWKVTVLAVLAGTIIVLGPHWWRNPVWIGMPIILIAVLLLGFVLIGLLGSRLGQSSMVKRIQQKFPGQWWAYRLQFVPHVIVLGLLLALVFAISDSAARPDEAFFYRHVVLFLLAILLPALFVAGGMALLLFRRYDAAANKNVKVLESDLNPLKVPAPTNPNDLAIDYKRLFRGLIVAPFYHAAEILWWPAIAVVLIANPETMTRWAFYTGIVAWAVYAVGEMHEHLGYMLGALRRALFLGGQLVVSILVILLAAGRLFDNSYIATLISAEPVCLVEFGNYQLCLSNLVLLGYIASAYIVFWYFEYWLNRILCDRLLGVFDKNNGETPGRIKVSVENNPSNSDTFYLQVHGASRFALMKVNNAGSELIDTFGRRKLIDEILIDGNLSVKDFRGIPCLGDQRKLVLKHRARFYFFAVYLLLAIPFGLAAYLYASMPQRAELETKATNPAAGTFNLRAALFDGDGSASCAWPEGARRQAIVLAASGGGTRAALYTYSVMRGLRQIELANGCSALHAVTLLSGVSGGSAALAYFKVHRPELLGTEPNSDAENPWRKFRDTMAAPFFQDALLGASEMRLLYGCPMPDRANNGGANGSQDETMPQAGAGANEGMRLSTMLRESFDRRFALDFAGQQGPRQFFDGCTPVATGSTDNNANRLLIGRWDNAQEVGLIFNTALAGQFPVSGASADMCKFNTKNTSLSLWEVTDRGKQCRTSLGKGGRLILTNLLDAPQLFPADDSGPEGSKETHINYEVVNDPDTPVATAAALSANFPPVFPNAAVDVGKTFRFWVTDGGAADNRGLVSLLYALQKTIKKQEGWATQPDVTAPGKPEIHVLMVDAGALGPAYSQDRGIGSALGSAERFASQLIADKWKAIETTYGKSNIKLHDLAMPPVLRSDGGIGTHWMLPESVVLRPPFGTGQDARYWPNPCTDIATELNSLDRILRFLDLAEPGCKLKREEIMGLFDALHGDDPAWLANLATTKPSLREWICAKPPGTPQHDSSWSDLVQNLTGKRRSYCAAPAGAS